MALPPVIGSYQPLVQLASGGMATVYVVRLVGARGFERLVAMKRVHPHLHENREFCAMFLDEARISSLIKHPNIVPVIDVVEDNEELFLIMEYVESVSLADLLKAVGAERLSPPVVSRIICDVLAGLNAAHEAVDLRGQPLGIVHRDVSPQNIIVGADGTSRLIDFGIAKAASRLTPTTTGVLKGKIGYMSPEQLRQQPPDRRADVYAAGVVLHETLTSTRLFACVGEADTLLAVMVGEVPDPSSLVPGLPERIDAVVHRALARDRDQRFATAAEFSDALLEACPRASPSEVAELVKRVCADALNARQRELHAAMDRPTPAPMLVAVAPSKGAPMSRRRLAILGAGALFVVGSVAAAAIVGAGSHPAALPATSSTEVTAPSTASPPPEPAPAAVIPPPAATSASAGRASPLVPRSPPPPARSAGRPKAPDIHLTNPYVTK